MGEEIFDDSVGVKATSSNRAIWAERVANFGE
jgi:hypothetical protein